MQGLGQVNRDLVQALGQPCPDQQLATVDQDATIMESRKREALPSEEGECGYQPMLAVWAETNVLLADEFRDGNVPAQMDPLGVAQRRWSKREKQLDMIIGNTSGMYGDLQGLLGASMQPIPLLEAGESEEVQADSPASEPLEKSTEESIPDDIPF